jgi:peptidoglycan/LPS O-acetylase OafA/YrhL
MPATTAITDPPVAAEPLPGGAAAAAAAHAAFLRRDRFANLDGLRFFCIFAVLWHHSPAISALADPPRILTRGFLGVDFFFVLSGFLITTLLLRERARRGRFSLKAFYWRRFLRIVPVYVFLVTLVSAWFVLVRGHWNYAPLVPAYYLFLANFLTTHVPLLYPLWSLSVEEQYYLIWPLLLSLLPRRAVLPVLAVLVAANLAGSIGLFGSGPQLGVLRIALPNATYAPILLGSALAVVLDRRRGFRALAALVGNRWAPVWTAALILGLVWIGPDDLRGLPNLTIHLAMTLCLAALVVNEASVARPLLTWRPLARIGAISYGVYLYHLIGRQAGVTLAAPFHGFALQPALATLIYVVAAIVIAEISFRSLEAYFRRFRHRPLRRLPPAAV